MTREHILTRRIQESLDKLEKKKPELRDTFVEGQSGLKNAASNFPDDVPQGLSGRRLGKEREGGLDKVTEVASSRDQGGRIVRECSLGLRVDFKKPDTSPRQWRR
ncbi:hypothetical protein PV325_012453 [Microctonus aethiopoides]|nr:hypothetical protein PV325_012453 [Microctonus aethiopoides]